jgi:hypothetical protein
MVNRRPARILALSAALICVGAPAYADPIKYALVNAIFDDGGKSDRLRRLRSAARP